ncbi:hypothetical protein QN277_018559 [Acacia crassicarpa]|uniref:Uncharacterized protein n=1 Tax=Acacia crassicarpa TaxID=499986 RepID=A0AAE1MUT5_9FABA|nr:hypothetical protein QN277_018559 [Acacia crassicarpa]
MASSASSSLLLKLIYIPIILTSLLSLQVWSFKSPLNPQDLLPLLPRQVSWPIIDSLHSAVNLLPSFVGSVSYPDDALEWKGLCFYENMAWMEFHNNSGTEFGGGTLHIKVGF